MRLKDLLRSCDFEDIVPYLLKIDSALLISKFKVAYDLLCHMDYRINEEVISVEWDDEQLYETLPIRIGNCEGDSWENNLGKRIVTADSIKISGEELAALCLWSTTFFPRDKKWDETKPLNQFEKAAENLVNKQFNNYLYKKRIKADRRKDENGIESDSLEEIIAVNKRQRKRNRLKRMRDHRQDLRIEQLDRMGEIERIIQTLLSNASRLTYQEVSYLFHSEKVRAIVYQSCSQNTAQRLSYLVELFSRYDREYFSRFTKLILTLSTSASYPLSEEEKSRLKELESCFSPSAGFLWDYVSDESVGQEIKLLIVGSY